MSFVILKADCMICAACPYLHIAVLAVLMEIYLSSPLFYHHHLSHAVGLRVTIL